MIQLDIDHSDWLYKSYMSFGGIYFFSNENFTIGNEVFLVLIKIDSINKKYPIRGEIVWKNSNLETAGYGVSFGNDGVGQAVKQDIEALLKNVLDSDNKTFTM